MTYLVTGGMGCIGAWVIKHLLARGEAVVNFDISDDRHRLDLLLDQQAQADITFLQRDLTDFQQVKAAFREQGVTRVIHLGALQVPMCRANPVLGARVNVTGTVNIFEAARQCDVAHITYASSIAVYGPPDLYGTNILTAEAPRLPQTLYGVYKVANEDTARIYWQDHGISSTTLRPYTVYGVGRDQGLTSEPTKAMAAAGRGQDYHIPFGGRMQFQLASDIALQFIEAADNALPGSFGFNLGTTPVAVQEVADLIGRQRPDVSITVREEPLPFPDGCDGTALANAFQNVYETPLSEGIAQTMVHFQQLASG